MRRWIAIALLALLPACPAPRPPATPSPPVQATDPTSLYARLGGQDVLDEVVDDLLAGVLTDRRLGRFFRDVDVARFKAQLLAQFCQATGGPCIYGGRAMREAHAGLRITAADFRAFLRRLDRALDRNRVAARERREVVQAMASFEDLIVSARSRRP